MPNSPKGVRRPGAAARPETTGSIVPPSILQNPATHLYFSPPEQDSGRTPRIRNRLINATVMATIEYGLPTELTMKNRRNYYRILQVQPDAPLEIIRASYRAMMRELKRHPDLGGSTPEASALNEAYETLSDPVRRAIYDEELFVKYTKQSHSYTKQPITPTFCPICKRPLSRKPEPGEICLTCQTPLQSERAQQLGSQNNRSLQRTKSSDPIDYYSTWPGEAKQGRMIDFSPKGMRFLCGEKLAPQTILKIRSRLFEASGTVTNLSEEISSGESCYAVGVCFLAVRFTESRGTFLSTSA
jgi:hypothetical protein